MSRLRQTRGAMAQLARAAAAQQGCAARRTGSLTAPALAGAAVVGVPDLAVLPSFAAPAAVRPESTLSSPQMSVVEKNLLLNTLDLVTVGVGGADCASWWQHVAGWGRGAAGMGGLGVAHMSAYTSLNAASLVMGADAAV